ncbi:MAG: UDP-N-acetylmuramoyl-L-alanine--D-glutamate ligase [Deltaproteobacteria bacterium]|nr:UDP-N-acetylmuramoyl-L-alanine--D-glutamate ligase [Deltaproteobacteria bacterium]
MDLKDKKILVIGLARTGVALCRFLAERGARVTVTDMASPASLAEPRRQIAGLGITEELGIARPRWQGYDLIIPSPGVPPELVWLNRARESGIPVWGELELASHFIEKPLLAVSGTNGKTTTTTLVGELLKASGLRPLVGGNIGTPVISLLARQHQADFLVLEVSSFQLDTAPSLHPQAAALLNITPDHLDRYPSLAAYAASKAGLFRHMRENELKVLNAGDKLVATLGGGPGRVSFFSSNRPLTRGAWLADESIHLKLDDAKEELFPVADIRLSGCHNLENVMAALTLALDAGAVPEACRRVLASFQGLPHRLEFVAEVDRVAFYDDSKGTNVGAVAVSLAYFSKPVILIAGGRDKDSDFSLISPLIRERVKALVLLGETQERLSQVWKGLAPICQVKDLAEAVRRAHDLARPGEVVLLSPACASFDMFKDYVHRGETFQRLVKELQHAN